MSVPSAAVRSRHARSTRTRSAKRGFTLVELLVVIAIIGMLMGLLTVTVWKAIEGAKEGAVVVEIDQLAQAVQAYKEQSAEYPPSMADAVPANRAIRFMQHLRRVFPNSAYGVRAVDYVNLNARVQAFYRVLLPSGQRVNLDLDRLDQAEALVFWIGGFPTPANVMGNTSGTASTPAPGPVANRRLFGFNLDADNPIKRSTGLQEGVDPLQTRSKPKYDFVDTRLTDNDGDGWWEYSPVSLKTGSLNAPFVYFDADTYASATGSAVGYPRQGDANAPAMYQTWGISTPMAEYFDPTGTAPTRWKNSDSFQILTAGLDGVYSNIIGSNPANGQRITIFPTGYTYMAPNYSSPPRSYSDPELDNLTSLARQRLDGARTEAVQ